MKIYFWIVVAVALFAVYYQSIASGTPLSPHSAIGWVIHSVVFIGAYAHLYHKTILPKTFWQRFLIVLIIYSIGRFLLLFWPTNYQGDFSLLNASLLTNVFVYLFGIIFLLPIYQLIYALANSKERQKRKSKVI